MRDSTDSRHCGARRRWSKRSPGAIRLGFEPLEIRTLLSAVPPVDDLTVLDSEVPPALAVASPAVLAESSDGTIALVRAGAVAGTFAPAANNDADRGQALRDALAAALPDDEVVLGAFTYDVGSQGSVFFPAHVTVSGAGQQLTKISSSTPQWVDGNATFTLNNGTTIEDLWLAGTLLDGNYQPLVGMQGGPTENVTTYLRRVNITGDSDGIFLWTGSLYTYSIYAYDCNISTKYDAVAILGSGFNPQTVKLYNCTINVAQPDPILAHTSNGINARSGRVELYNSDVTVTGDANSLLTTGVYVYNQGSVLIANSRFHVSAPAGVVDDLFIQGGVSCIVAGGQGSGPGGAFVSSSGSEQYFPTSPSQVADRSIFYNNSLFDGKTSAGTVDDALAIAPGKEALLPGDDASLANVTSYSKGINGVMIDLAGIHGQITVGDFLFKVGSSNDPTTWSAAPAPSYVEVWGGEGSNGSDRIQLIWDDGAIKNKWLEVTLFANADTGLPSPDVFYFGNRIGDTGLGSGSSASAITSAVDQVAVRTHQGAGQTISSLYDFNRDGIVNATDQIVARNNVGTLLLIDPTALAAPTAALSTTASTGGESSNSAAARAAMDIDFVGNYVTATWDTRASDPSVAAVVPTAMGERGSAVARATRPRYEWVRDGKPLPALPVHGWLKHQLQRIADRDSLLNEVFADADLGEARDTSTAP